MMELDSEKSTWRLAILTYAEGLMQRLEIVATIVKIRKTQS